VPGQSAPEREDAASYLAVEQGETTGLPGRARPVAPLSGGARVCMLVGMNTTPSKTRGVWGAIAEATDDSREDLASALVRELDEGFALLETLAPAVTFFGGARIQPDDPYYAAAERMGELLADRGVPPRTGAGPGIMAAVPEGFRRRLDARGEATGAALPARALQDGPQPLTQGFNIILPFEQELNPAIDVSLELAHFPTRKLMLYKNCVGLLIFPGGFGTLDELLEVWRLKAAGALQYPFVLYGRDFWRPLAEGLRAAAASVPAATIPPEVFRLLSWADDPEEAMSLGIGPDPEARGAEPLRTLGARIARELVEGLGYLQSLAPAVTVLGGSRLTEDDAVVAQAERLARALAVEGVPTRAGGPGQLSVALARGGHAGAEHLPQQAFGMRRRDARNLYGADRVHLVSDRLTHKVLLTEGSIAVVALPGGLGTLDELFSVICQLQTQKIANRRIVLLGSAYWTPLFASIREVMLDGPRRTIGPHDLELLTITDDPEEAAALALTPPPERGPKTGRA